MKDFIDKWQNEPKFKTKIKLVLYTAFVIIITIYASALNHSSIPNNLLDDTKEPEESKSVITIPEKYTYEINIDIDNEILKYTGTKDTNTESIVKEKNNIITNYKYENKKYYIENNGSYILVNKNEIYDVTDYNYINLDSISEYMKTATKENNQYLVYLKDIILDNTSETYFVINVLDNIINIDYTPLMKEFDQSIEKYNVIIKYEEVK